MIMKDHFETAIFISLILRSSSSGVMIRNIGFSVPK